MILQPARIIAATPDHYLLETLPKSACPRCAEGKGCGGGILAQAFANKTYKLSIPLSSTDNNQHHENEMVQVGMHSQSLLMAALVMYLLPLTMLLAGSLGLGLLFGFDDKITVLGAVLGMVIGVLIANKLSRSMIESGQTRPFIVEEPGDSCFYQVD